MRLEKKRLEPAKGHEREGAKQRNGIFLPPSRNNSLPHLALGAEVIDIPCGGAASRGLPRCHHLGVTANVVDERLQRALLLLGKRGHRRGERRLFAVEQLDNDEAPQLVGILEDGRVGQGGPKLGHGGFGVDLEAVVGVGRSAHDDENVVKLGADHAGIKGLTGAVVEDDVANVVAQMPLALQLLAVLARVRQQRGDVEHDFFAVLHRVHAVRTRGAVCLEKRVS